MLGNRFVILALAALGIVPMLYASLYLYANWDPYGRFEHLPVAVVNEDRGAVLKGVPITAGETITRRLRERKDFAWRFMNRAQAIESLQDRDVYLVVTLPADFSQRIAALGQGESLTPAEVKLITNPAKNYIGGQLSANIGRQVVDTINVEIAKELIGGVLIRVNTLAGGLSQADTALGEIADGTDRLAAGSGQLLQGFRSAREGAGKLASGADALVAGQKALVSGLAQTKDGTEKLRDRMAQAAPGAGRIKDGLTKLGEGSRQIASRLGPGIEGLKDIEKGLGTVGDGSRQMAQQLGAAADGIGLMEQGLGTLGDGAGQLATGVGTAADHLREIQGRVQEFEKELADIQANPLKLARMNPKQMREDLARLDDGVGQLATGLETAEGKLHDMKNGAAQIATGAHTVRNGIGVAASKLGEIHDGTAKMASGARNVREGLGNAVAKIGDVAEGTDQLRLGAETLQSGLGSASTGLGQLYSAQTTTLAGAEKLLAGARTLDDGLIQLNHGVSGLVLGGSHVADGAIQVAGGAKLLHAKLGQGVAELKSAHLEETDGLANFLSHPVGQKLEEINPVPNYGTGFAPYFIGLALWIGLVMACFLIRMDDAPEAANARSALRYVTKKFLALGFIALVQTIVLLAVLQTGLGLQIAKPWGFYALTYLTSLTFMTFISLCVFSLGLAGRFLSVIVLLAQLVTAGGTFPYELMPPILREISPWFPMTYSVSGMRSLISGGQNASPAFWALGGFALAFALASTLVIRFGWRLQIPLETQSAGSDAAAGGAGVAGRA